jgi:hypothetical protein
MTLKRKIFKAGGYAARRLKLPRYFNIKDDDRLTFPYKMVFMSGKSGIAYLNACLVSIYHTWDQLPEIVVISDGTPLSLFDRELIDWPRKIDVILWEEAAAYFREKGNTDLCQYAQNIVYGRKFISLLYMASKFPILYCDTDVLWFAQPELPEMPEMSGDAPFIKMGVDVGKGFYTEEILLHLEEEKCFANAPFNSGLMYLHGDFSSYPKWPALCRYLSGHKTRIPGTEFSEQTAFAILNNHFNGRSWWKPTEILIKTDDEYGLAYTRKHFPDIMARHYVHTKPTAFWRDFIYMALGKPGKPVQKSLPA